jgi:hypothetical protein
VNHDEELKRRFEHFAKCQDNKGLRDLEVAMCEKDIFHFISNWVWTFDPRTKQAHLPFTLYDFQVESFKWIDDRFANKEVGIIEKSRDMGATWIIVVWAIHHWLFSNGFTCLFGSKTEGDVDDQSKDSIFGKIRYVIDSLPWFLKPDMREKINTKRDADSYLSIINPINGNEISGDSANSNFGRSGRRSIVFLDEFAFVENSDKIWSAISEVSNVIIPVSTANGKGNMFYALRSKGTVPVLSLHWTKHPNKNKGWYDDKKKTMEPHQVAQELDIDYSSSKSGRVYKRFDKMWHVSKEIIKPNPAFEQFITWDFGIADNMCMIFGQIDIHNDVEIYACYDTTDQDIEFFFPLVKGRRPDRIFWMGLADHEKKRIDDLLSKVFSDNILNFNHYGDFAGTQRSANNRRSVRDRMQTEAGISLKVTSVQDHATRIQALDNLFKLKENKSTRELSSRFKVSPDCERLIDSVMNYVWDKEDVNNPNLKPKHDWASHYTTALEFMAINRFPIRNTGKVTVEKFR